MILQRFALEEDDVGERVRPRPEEIGRQGSPSEILERSPWIRLEEIESGQHIGIGEQACGCKQRQYGRCEHSCLKEAGHDWLLL